MPYCTCEVVHSPLKSNPSPYYPALHLLDFNSQSAFPFTPSLENLPSSPVPKLCFGPQPAFKHLVLQQGNILNILKGMSDGTTELWPRNPPPTCGAGRWWRWADSSVAPLTDKQDLSINNFTTQTLRPTARSPSAFISHPRRVIYACLPVWLS